MLFFSANFIRNFSFSAMLVISSAIDPSPKRNKTRMPFLVFFFADKRCNIEQAEAANPSYFSWVFQVIGNFCVV